jgi:catechol 2,3-dioxygenase-like lactoylglutathione lyase family enzyme
MLRGLTTVTYPVDDVKAARKWYADLLGIEPYFERPDAENPAYVEFRIGDYQDELGLIDRTYVPPAAPTGPAGATIYWHVDALGATVHDPLTVREAGFVTASVVDPFGNILGLMHSPHYLETLEAAKRG